MAKNNCTAYFLWLVGGWLGLHHFYLNRDRQAFVWGCTGGFLGLGLLRDFWRIPDYVNFANKEPGFMDRLRERVSRLVTPSFSLVRFLGQLGFAVFLGYLSALAIPDNFSVTFPMVRMLIVSTAVALGVHTVGNIGYEGGPYRPAICGALIVCPCFTLPNGILCQSLVLRLRKDATKSDIKRQYRKLALKYHPDKYTDVSSEEAERKFIELREAYETLLKIKEREDRQNERRP